MVRGRELLHTTYFFIYCQTEGFNNKHCRCRKECRLKSVNSLMCYVYNIDCKSHDRCTYMRDCFSLEYIIGNFKSHFKRIFRFLNDPLSFVTTRCCFLFLIEYAYVWSLKVIGMIRQTQIIYLLSNTP